jgi:carbonic anhydrase
MKFYLAYFVIILISLKLSSINFISCKSLSAFSKPKIILENWLQISKSRSNIKKGEKFYLFILTSSYMYYYENISAINPIDVIEVSNIKRVNFDKNKLCFTIEDNKRNKISICSKELKITTNWLCKISEFANIEIISQECKIKNSDYNYMQPIEKRKKYIYKNILKPYIANLKPSKECNERWNYKNKGQDWECQCKEGKKQSPINLPKIDECTKTRSIPRYEYSSQDLNEFEFLISSNDTTNTKFNINDTDNNYGNIVYENSFLKINNENMGKIITPDGDSYTAQQILFHTPSEHTIEGKSYELEMQIIHRNPLKGREVILIFLIQSQAGFHNKFFNDLNLVNLPNINTNYQTIQSKINIDDLFDSDINFSKTINKMPFYTYEGSSTYPPCSEHSIYYVSTEIMRVSVMTVNLFKEAMQNPNTRKTQPLNDRKIYCYSNNEYNFNFNN